MIRPSWKQTRWFVFKLLDIYVQLKPGVRIYIGTPLFGIEISHDALAFDRHAIVRSIEIGLLMNFLLPEGSYLYRWRWVKTFKATSVQDLMK